MTIYDYPDEEARIEIATQAVAAVLASQEALYCTRVWSAWSFGTMGPDDFTPASEEPTALREIAMAALGLPSDEVGDGHYAPEIFQGTREALDALTIRTNKNGCKS